MKIRKNMRVLTLFLLVSFSTMADNYLVFEKQGSSRQVALDQVRSVVFASGELIVNMKQAANSFAFGYDQLKYFSVKATESGIKDLQVDATTLGLEIEVQSEGIVVQSESSIKQVSVYTLLGSHQLTLNPLSEKVYIPIQNLSTGIYLLKLVNERGQMASKFIKK